MTNTPEVNPVTLPVRASEPALGTALSNVLDALAGFEPATEADRPGWNAAAAVCLEALLRWDSPSGAMVLKAMAEDVKVVVIP